MTAEKFCDELLRDLAGGVHFARQAVSDDRATLRAAAEMTVRGIGAMPAQFRVLRADLSEELSFAGLLRRLLQQIFDDPKFDSADTMVRREDFEAVEDETELKYQFSCVVQDDLGPDGAGVRLLLLLENYDRAAGQWRPGDYGWLRGIACDSPALSIAVFADRSADRVSGEPVGSSPFANIFDAPVHIDGTVA